MQDRIYRKTFAKWIEDSKTDDHKPYWMEFRDLNMETSLRVFCGSYISEKDAQEVSAKYWQITQALELVNFPFGSSFRPPIFDVGDLRADRSMCF